MLIIDELEYIHIQNTAASAKIALQGAHLFDFQIHGKKKLLFVSETSFFKEGKAIRGGIPICWPWFGAHETDTSLPNHGFARNSLWRHESTEDISESETKVRLTLENTPQTYALWPYEFLLTLDIYIGEQLKLVLTSKNLDTKAFSITSALHTYFEIENIYKTTIEGLAHMKFYNKCNDTSHNVQEGDIDFKDEVDRVYHEVQNDVIIHDNDQDILLKTEGSSSIVVWNPGKELTENMPDLSGHEHMLCVESANVMSEERVLEPQMSYSLTVTISQN
jgi:glucose-6-phosphate 1-epimerase